MFIIFRKNLKAFTPFDFSVYALLITRFIIPNILIITVFFLCKNDIQILKARATDDRLIYYSAEVEYCITSKASLNTFEACNEIDKAVDAAYSKQAFASEAHGVFV